MNFIPFVMLFTFVELIICSNLLINKYLPKIKIPFLTIISASIVNLMLTIFLMGNFIFWILVFIFTTISCFYLLKNIKLIDLLSIKTNSSIFIAWAIAITITSGLLLNALFLQPPTFEPNAKLSSGRDKLMTQFFQGEDNFSHISIVEAINKSHRSTYFDGATPKIQRIHPTLLSYAELPHSTTSAVETALYNTARFTNHRVTPFTALLYSYILVHFFMAGMLIGLLVCLAIKLIEYYARLTTLQKIVIVILSSAFMLRTTVFPLLDVGFFSQSAGLLSLFICIYLEIDANFQKLFSQRPTLGMSLKLIPIIAVGNSWWILLPVCCLLFFFTQIKFWYIRLRKKELYKLLIEIFVTLFALLLALIPSIIQSLIFEPKLTDFVNTAGGLPEISVFNSILMISLALLFVIISYFICKDKFLKHVHIVCIIFVGSFLACLLGFAFYQYHTQKAFSYYTFKLAWSILWIGPVILSVMIVRLLLFLKDKSKTNKKISVFITIVPYRIITLIIICYLLISSLAIHNINLSNSPSIKALSDFAQAIDKANSVDKPLVIMSDCTTISDYYYQRASSSSQAKSPVPVYLYMKNVFNATKTEREKLQKDFIKANSSNIIIFDNTPTEDLSSPLDRLDIGKIIAIRTTVDKPNSSEIWTSQCLSSQTSTIP